MLEKKKTIRGFKLKQRFKHRLFVFLFIVTAYFSLLVVRLVDIQIFKGDHFYERSQRVIRRVLPIKAPRGEVYDRHYKKNNLKENLIISSHTTINLIAVPSHFKHNDLMLKLDRLETLLGLPNKSLKRKIRSVGKKKEKKIVLIENLTEKQHTIFADYYIEFTNFIVEQSVQRKYNLGRVASHITGYIGPPSKKDIQTRGIKQYQKVGKNGIESYYDLDLRGEDGEMVQIKNAPGKIEEQKVLTNFKPGNNLILTIDNKMQSLASKVMGEKTGAIIAFRPSTGEILTLVSKPDYDPNILISTNKEKKRSAHIKYMRRDKAELNRAISTKSPPASTFKVLVALAGLEEDRVSSSQAFHCSGKHVLKSSYKGLPDTTFFCWGTHGRNKLVHAIAYSCSSYFYQLGYRIGSEPILKYARYFKLDKISGIDLPNEVFGFIPSPLWKEKTYKQRWFDGDTINLSIGQGFIETTLISLSLVYSGLVMNGVIYRPHILKETRYVENDTIKQVTQPEIINELPLNRKNLQIVKEGLKGVTEYGTTRGLFKKMYIAGKTGTVQVRSDRRIDPNQHAWFIGYGPYNQIAKNMIVVGVFIEKGGSGTAGAAPLAQELFRYWINHYNKII